MLLKLEAYKTQLNEKEQKLQNNLKTKQNMENRIKDLELKCQNIPFIEKEKEKFQEKEKHLNEANKRLEFENQNLKKTIKDGNFGSGSGGMGTNIAMALSSGPKVENAGIFKKIQKVTKNLGMLRVQAKETVGQTNYNFRDKFEIYSLNCTINKLTDQIVDLKHQQNSEVLEKIKKDMPLFNQFMKKSKIDEQSILAKEAKATIQKVQGIATNVKKAISTAKLIDCTPSESESGIQRIIRLNKDVKRQEAGIQSAIYRATSELKEFRSRWASSQILQAIELNTGLFSKETTSIEAEKVIGHVKIESAPTTAPEINVEKVVKFKPGKFELKQAIQF